MALCCAALLLTILLAAPAPAQVGDDARSNAMNSPGAGSIFSIQSTPPILKQVGITQRMGEQVPLDLVFRDENGREVKLAEYFNTNKANGDKPVILVLAYFQCPRLCGQVLQGLLKGMENMEGLDISRDFTVLTVSFDARETPDLAMAKKGTYTRAYKRGGAEAGWHFLTGKQAPIDLLAESVGFKFNYDPVGNQFAHASGIMVLTPEGKVSRYLLGIDYSPRDLRLALVEASNKKISSPVDMALLYCFHYDPVAGKYNLAVMRLMRTAGVLTIFGLFALIFVLRRRPPASVQSPAVTLG